MKKHIIKIVFTDTFISKKDISKLRGYFSGQFPNNVELHNHLPNGKFSYYFPTIQYRVINRHPALIAMNDSKNIIKKIFFNTDKIILQSKIYKSDHKEIGISEEEIGKSNYDILYCFDSPWMALNQKNFRTYMGLSLREKSHFLNHLLRENLKTLSKGFEYTIPDIEKIKVRSNLRPHIINFKNKKMLTFYGDFSMNFHIPEYFGLGKQTARGFGIVKQQVKK